MSPPPGRAAPSFSEGQGRALESSSWTRIFGGASGSCVCALGKPGGSGFRNDWIQRLERCHENPTSRSPLLIPALLREGSNPRVSADGADCGHVPTSESPAGAPPGCILCPLRASPAERLALGGEGSRRTRVHAPLLVTDSWGLSRASHAGVQGSSAHAQGTEGQGRLPGGGAFER